jgi:hypothetical protein
MVWLFEIAQGKEEGGEEEVATENEKKRWDQMRKGVRKKGKP